MDKSAELREQAAPAQSPATPNPGVGAKVRHGVGRAFFWSYERGSWQYDVIVALILVFIFLTPRAWFRRDPILGMVDLRHVQGLVEIAHEKTRHTYVMDARLLQSRSSQAVEEAAKDLLHERLGKEYRVVSVEPVRDPGGVLLSYKVVAEE